VRLAILSCLLTPWAAAQIPEFVHGDECLFCHRNDIGPGWRKNAHGTTVRQREDAPDLAKRHPEAELFLGGRNHVRMLKKDGYGRFAIQVEGGGWDKTKFADRCAGCHTTAVDAKTKTFAYFGLDCYTCHGVVDLNHGADTSLILLSRKRRDASAVVNSICAQCHLRGGASKSTGLPYPANFVPGGELFADYRVDWKIADDVSLNPGDRHVWRNARDVATGATTSTCLSCHAVHTGSTEKHRRAAPGPICLDCHFEGKPRSEFRRYTVHSAVCEY
jgi:predicted CXXCH cytochrome family protein